MTFGRLSEEKKFRETYDEIAMSQAGVSRVYSPGVPNGT